jgi:hypothetical protein
VCMHVSKSVLPCAWKALMLLGEAVLIVIRLADVYRSPSARRSFFSEDVIPRNRIPVATIAIDFNEHPRPPIRPAAQRRMRLSQGLIFPGTSCSQPLAAFFAFRRVEFKQATDVCQMSGILCHG